MDLEEYYSEKNDLDFKAITTFSQNAIVRRGCSVDKSEMSASSTRPHLPAPPVTAAHGLILEEKLRPETLIAHGHENQAAFILLGMLQLVCELCSGGDKDNERRLYFEMGKLFVNLGMMDRLLFYGTTSGNQERIRDNLRDYFLKRDLRGLWAPFKERPNTPLAPFTSPPVTLHSPPILAAGKKKLLNSFISFPSQIHALSLLEANYTSSRYQRDFVEVRPLGKGGFGKVFHLVNKTDECHYAVKKIHLGNTSIAAFEKIMREVKLLSRLGHVNVVGYHSSWLESEEKISTPQLKQQNSLTSSSSSYSSSSLEEESVLDGKPAHSWGEADSVSQSTDGFTTQSECSTSLTFASNTAKSSVVSLESSTPAHKYPVKANVISTIEQKGGASSLCLYIQMQLCDLTLSEWIEKRNKAFFKVHRFPETAVPVTTSTTATTAAAAAAAAAAMYDDGVYDITKAATDFRFTFTYNDMSRQGLLTACDLSVREIFQQIVSGLHYIHEKGVIHRDIKPANIFFRENTIKLGDFGLARIQDSLTARHYDYEDDVSEACPHVSVAGSRAESLVARHSEKNSSSSVHTSGVGTAAYASPEQLKSMQHTSKADIYSLGLILLELIYPMASGMERAKVLKDAREGILPAGMDGYGSYAMLIRLMTAKNPKERPGAGDILTMVNLHLQSTGVAHHYVSPPHPIFSSVSTGCECQCRTCEANIASLRSEIDVLRTKLNELTETTPR